ncbi:Hypothetical_protein [Hexamita inflata]|uniref:Hypothetical_protein n=1 Tax=Hexamita inflata TaxID=28002 RepID=A0AA86QBU4_9EUKA|nr:Hypothetical protein HINF_LOCUS42748 [Hexamita inflata]
MKFFVKQQTEYSAYSHVNKPKILQPENEYLILTVQQALRLVPNQIDVQNSLQRIHTASKQNYSKTQTSRVENTQACTKQQFSNFGAIQLRQSKSLAITIWDFKWDMELLKVLLTFLYLGTDLFVKVRNQLLLQKHNNHQFSCTKDQITRFGQTVSLHNGIVYTFGFGQLLMAVS